MILTDWPQRFWPANLLYPPLRFLPGASCNIRMIGSSVNRLPFIRSSCSEKPCELVRAVTRVLPRDEVRLREGAVMVLDYTGMDNPDC